jgi:hypothetical protein
MAPSIASNVALRAFAALNRVYAKHGEDIGSPPCNLWKSVPIQATFAVSRIGCTTARFPSSTFPFRPILRDECLISRQWPLRAGS